LPVGVSRFATDVEANALRGILHRTTKARNVRAQAPRSDLQSLRPARDTGPPRVRTTNPPAKKDSRSKGSKARPAPGSARRPGRVVKGRGRPQTRKG
jgi:hypothetical protein